MIKILRRLTWAAAALSPLLALSTANAGLVTYFGQDLQTARNANGAGTPVVIAHPNSDVANQAFLSRLTGVQTESFEGVALNTPVASVVTNLGGSSTTFTGQGRIVNNNSPNAPSGSPSTPTQLDNGRFAISGTQFLATQDDFTVNFTSPQAAFGFYATDIGDVRGTLTIQFLNGSSSIVGFPVPPMGGISGPRANGSVLFFGLVGDTTADLFSSVRFNLSTTENDVFGFDDLTVGNLGQVITTPEPTSMIPAALAGLFGIGYFRYGRRAKSGSR